MAGLTIKDAPIAESINGEEKFPISNKSGKAVAATIKQVVGLSLKEASYSDFNNDFNNDF